jgi:hypothetical protein
MFASPTRFIKLRDEDTTGNGWYGASRGSRKHKGTDYVTFPGEEIFACMSGRIRVGNVYKGSTKMKLIEIVNKFGSHRYRLQQMYVKSIFKTGDVVKINQLIGHSQNVAKYHNSNKMKNHCHVSVWKNGLLTDPEPIINE